MAFRPCAALTVVLGKRELHCLLTAALADKRVLVTASGFPREHSRSLSELSIEGLGPACSRWHLPLLG
jgi:hypothetical protein